MNERVFLQFVEAACRHHRIHLTVRSGGWLLELSKHGKIRHILGTNFGLNNQVAAAIAKDKVATAELLKEAGIDNIPHYLLKSREDVQVDSTLLKRLLAQSAVIVKPLEGSHGHLVTRIDTADAASALIDQPGVQSWAISPLVEIDHEVRMVIVDAHVGLAHVKTKPILRNGVKSFNLSSGATAERLAINEVSPVLVRMAVGAVEALGLRTAAVDIAVTSEGKPYVLEVNAAYSLTYYARTNKAAYDETALFYDRLIADLFES